MHCNTITNLDLACVLNNIFQQIIGAGEVAGWRYENENRWFLMSDKSGRRIAWRFAVRNFSEKQHFPSDLQSRVGVEKWLLNADLDISFRGLICCN